MDMLRVLLVDDDPISNFINQKIIEDTGLVKDILIANNGTQALEMLIQQEANLPDLVLLDINMPITSGFDLLTKLREKDFNKFIRLNIVILSSSDSSEDKKRAERLGVHTFLTKPISRDRLVDLLLT